jgi:hypothetical protein
MNAPRSNAAAWGKAGKEAAKSFYSIAETTRKYSPRYDEQAVVGMKARSLEKQAAIKAESKARQAANKAKLTVAKTDLKVDTAESLAESKKTVRKAGMVAAAGAAIGMALTPEEETVRPEFDTLRNYYNAQTEKDRVKLAGIESDMSAHTSTATSGSTSKKAPTASKPGPQSKGKGTGVRLMNFLVGKGYTPVSAAAIAGNAQHESGNFKFHEELAPNVHGTKGVGYLQWTGSRRGEFENWSRSQGIDPTSFEASAGYIDAEMQSGSHWSGGMTTEGFKGIQNLDDAVIAYQDKYLRPSRQYAHTDRRLQNSRSLLQQYNAGL